MSHDLPCANYFVIPRVFNKVFSKNIFPKTLRKYFIVLKGFPIMMFGTLLITVSSSFVSFISQEFFGLNFRDNVRLQNVGCHDTFKARYSKY